MYKYLVKVVIIFSIFMAGCVEQSNASERNSRSKKTSHRQSSTAKPTYTSTGQRVALIIGNGAYQDYNTLPILRNPVNDAEDISNILRKFGFFVITGQDWNKQQMEGAIAQFGVKAHGADVSLFYYSGHGIQIKNQNYLMPTDATVKSETQVQYQGVHLNYVLDEMDNANSKVKIAMLDACRNNAFTGKFRASGGQRGLAAPGAVSKNMVVVYATNPGNVASDGDGRNGTFTAGLLEAFKGQDLSLDGVLTEASLQVEKASNGEQVPYIDGPKLLQKRFVFANNAVPSTVSNGTTITKPMVTDTGNLTELQRQAQAAYNAANYGKTIEILSALAKQGDALSQSRLGVMYQRGLGVTQDYDEAIKWYRKAAEQGNAKGQTNLGVMYEYGYGVTQDYDEAIKWYRKAAEQGNAEGQTNLGFVYQNGYGVIQDYDEAVKWYRKAAEQSNAYGQNNLGVMYQNGYGVIQDYDEAVKWYRKAAEQSNAYGQNNLGVMYQNGYGVTQDYNEAVKWFRKAAEQGHADGQYNLGFMYQKGYGVTQDYDEAIKWYRKAAEQGHPEAKINKFWSHTLKALSID